MAIGIERRGFIAALGAATAWPLAGRAQQAAMPVIGFLNSGSPDGFTLQVTAFRQGLNEAGYVEGQNVAIEYRWANDQYDRLAALADDLVKRRVSVIAATSTPANLVAKASTSTIPIVFTAGGDPVRLGLVASLNQPGGNVTGVTQLAVEVVPKRLEVLHELVPAASVMALLVNPTDRTQAEPVSQEAESAARRLGLQLRIVQVSAEHDLEGVFASFSQMTASALVIGGGAFFNNHTEELAALAILHSVPAIAQYRQFVTAGGLASYGGSITESYRLAGVYTGRILKGEKPADLPVQQATKVDLIINLKTAKALNITVPISLLGRADEVIE
jgi:putative ABC transport system substrate-binding protein